MAGLNETSRIVNTVAFKVDMNSFKQAKKSVTDLQAFIKKQSDSTQNFGKYINAAKKAEAQIAAVQAQRINKQVQGIDRAAAAQKLAERQAQQAARRAEAADIKRRNTLLDLSGIIGRTAQEEADVARQAIRVTRAFESGSISAARMNQQIREQLTLTRRLARDRTRANRSGGGGSAGGKSEGGMLGKGLGAIGLGSIAGPVGVAVAAGALVAHEAISRASDSITETTERNQGVITGARAVHMNPNALLGLAAYARQNGVMDSNPERIQDNFN